MTDVTSAVSSFREAARHLWNSAFLPDADWDARDRFSRVCTELFGALVLEPLGVDNERLSPMWEAHPAPLRCLEVAPASDSGIPIHINRDSPRTGYWDDAISRITPRDAVLDFIGFFDWDELARRDFAFLQVRISRFDAQPHLIGRHALVGFEYARVLFREPGAA